MISIDEVDEVHSSVLFVVQLSLAGTEPKATKIIIGRKKLSSRSSFCYFLVRYYQVAFLQEFFTFICRDILR